MGEPRAAVWAVAGNAAALLGCFVGAWFDARLAVAAAVAAVALVPAVRLSRRALRSLPTAAVPRGWVGVVVVALCALSVVQTARLGVFMLDDTRAWGAAVPGGNAGHACLAAYVRAGELSAASERIYDRELYSGGTAVAGMERWLSDPYQYPPVFLLGSRAALAVTNDFNTMRAAWFALHGVALAILLVWVGIRAAPERPWRALVAVAAVWSTIPALINLQYGQVHLLVIAMALAAMVAFERSKPWVGGGLLAAAISAKIFPGILVLGLILQRRWREVGVTAAWLAVLLSAAALVAGSAPFAEFYRDQLPQMSSGVAFAKFFDYPAAVAENQSIPGLGYKLRYFGAAVDPMRFAAAIKWLWLAVLVVAARFAAQRAHPRGWLALLVLASMLSPYAPGAYALAASLWLLALLAVKVQLTPLQVVVGGALWGLWQLAPVMGDLPLLWRWPGLAVAVSLPAIAATLAVCARCLSPGPGPEPEPG